MDENNAKPQRPNPFAPAGAPGWRDPALNPPDPQPSTLEPASPRTLPEALTAAYHCASYELLDTMSHGVPVSDLDPRSLDSWICAGAIYAASESLEPVLPEPFRLIVARGVATAAFYDVGVTLSSYEPDSPERTAALLEHKSTAPNAAEGEASRPEAHPREPRRPLNEAMQVALAQAYDEYQWDFPEGIPFEALGKEVYSLFFNRGRFAAFAVLEPVLPRETAIQMAEAIAEAAWQVRARELASAA